MSRTSQPPNERAARENTLSEHLLSLLASVLGYFQARVELAGLEGKEALLAYGKVAGFLVVATGLLFFGYIFLWIGIIALIALLSSVFWGWIVLGVGVLHVLGMIGCLLAAKANWGHPIFASTLNEFKKDQEWLNNSRQTAKRN